MFKLYPANVINVSELHEAHIINKENQKAMKVKKAEDAVARCQYIVAAIEELIKDRPEGGPVTDKIEYDKINDKFILMPL